MKSTRHARKGVAGQGRAAGLSLLEMLGYVAIITVVINLSLSVFLSASRLSAVGTVALDRLTMVEYLNAEFRRTVREAGAVVPDVGAFETGPEHVVLAMPPRPGQSETARYVVFGEIGREKRLSRLEIIEKHGEYTTEAYSTYALPVESLRFEYDRDDPTRARLVTLEVDALNARKEIRKPPVTYRFVGALRSARAAGRRVNRARLDDGGGTL